jgi:hypothetical protein
MGRNVIPWEVDMAKITLRKMERSGQEFHLEFDLVTNYGTLPFSTKVPDAGSPSQTERQALLELKEVLGEVLAEVSARLSS